MTPGSPPGHLPIGNLQMLRACFARTPPQVIPEPTFPLATGLRDPPGVPLPHVPDMGFARWSPQLVLIRVREVHDPAPIVAAMDFRLPRRLIAFACASRVVQEDPLAAMGADHTTINNAPTPHNSKTPAGLC